MYALRRKLHLVTQNRSYLKVDRSVSMRKSLSFYSVAGLLAALMVTSFGAFAAQVRLEMSKSNDSNHPVKYDLVVVNACEVDTLRFDLNHDGQAENFNNIEKIAIKKDGNKCGYARQLSPKEISGKILEVRLYKKDGSLVGDYLYVRVPCKGQAEQMSRSNNGDGSGYNLTKEKAKSFSCGNDPGPSNKGIGSTPSTGGNNQQEQPQQSCSIYSQVEGSNKSIVRVTATCALRTNGSEVTVMQGDRRISQKNINFDANRQTEVALIERPTDSTVVFTVEIRTREKGGQTFTSSPQKILKNPTFHYKQDGKVLTKAKDTPNREDKKGGRGDYWRSNIKVQVFDRDIEEEHNQYQIYVQLFNKTMGKVVREATLATTQAHEFELFAEFIEPYGLNPFSRSERLNHWDKDAQLQKGNNVIEVRVFDAYQTKNYIVVDTVEVNIVSDKVDEK